MRTSRTARLSIACLLLAALVVAGCSSGGENDVTTGDRSRLGGQDKGAKGNDGKGKGSGGGDKGSRGSSSENGSGGGGGSNGDKPEDPTASLSPSGSGATFGNENFDSDKGAIYARKSASVSEPQRDAETDGVPAPYTEAMAAEIQGLGKDLRMTLTMSGDVPQKMPNKNTYMVVAFSMAMTEDERYAFSAQGSQDGWQAYAGGKEDTKRFPGTFVIEGERIIMTVPWSYVGGPRTFKWIANSSWFSSIGGTTHYAYDPIPNTELAPFPDGG